MADNELAAKLQKRLASLDLDTDEVPKATSKIPIAPPPPPENDEPAPYLMGEQFADIDKLINDTLRYTESHETPVWRKQSSLSSITSVENKPVQAASVEDFEDSKRVPNPAGKCAPVVPIVHHKGCIPQKAPLNLEARLERLKTNQFKQQVLSEDSKRVPNPAGKCAPVVPIVHHKGCIPQKAPLNLEARLERERNELEEKLAKQRQKKTVNPPDILQGVKQSELDNELPDQCKDMFSPEPMTQSKNEPQKKAPFELPSSSPSIDTRVAIKSPPPTPKKPKCPMVGDIY
ncbi:hypothetical protein Tcan_06160 [Toxocara canis]|uniref:Uncharacterized protein n=1 Tax=Toxocara canis TaxID=6265 RepID=A0A0B2VVQ5_TOXCA|nr:hypothetical protein Tcan_06160 [Toxocara canis]